MFKTTVWYATDPSIPRDYARLLREQRPRHTDDAFSCRHPAMPLSRRAKLFQPYDALEGYSHALSRQRRRLEERRIPAQAMCDRLSSQLRKLARLCPNGRAALARRIRLTVTFFLPEPGHDRLGTYVTVTDLLQSVNPACACLVVGQRIIPFSDIWSLKCVDMAPLPEK